MTEHGKRLDDNDEDDEEEEEEEEDVSSSGDSDSDSEIDTGEHEDNIIDNKPLTLMDDVNLLTLPPEDDFLMGEDPGEDDEDESTAPAFDTKKASGDEAKRTMDALDVNSRHSFFVGSLKEPAGSGDTENETGDNGIDKKKVKKKKKKKSRRNGRLYTICLSNCKYDSVKRVSRRFGFREVADDEDWNLFWTDYSVNLERVCVMKKYQKINHFPGMSEVCRKDSLARNLNRMIKLFPKEYNIFPKSWCLPADYGDLINYARQKKHKTYILKPETGCQGKGIWCTRNVKDIRPTEHMVCQQYLSKPFLIDGFKFDIRLYILVTSCDPLRIFCFKDGLARFTTQKYCEPTSHNLDNIFMHLTNYAVQKTSENFIRDDEEGGTKRRITTMNRWFRDNGFDLEKIWNDIDDVVIKTLISAHSVLKHNYRTCFPNHVKGSACFEILGFDVIIDKKLKPYVLEVNHSPSFHTDARLDKEIKEALIWDSLQLVNFGAVDRRKVIEEEKRKIRDRLFQRTNRKEVNTAEQRAVQQKKEREEMDREAAKFLEIQERYENNHLGNFRRVYPGPGSEKYDKFFSGSGSLYQETAAFKARSECARQQREEIRAKQEKLESMLKKGPRRNLEPRPESPGSRNRRRLNRRPLRMTNRLPGYMQPRGTQNEDRVGPCLLSYRPADKPEVAATPSQSARKEEKSESKREEESARDAADLIDTTKPQPIVDEEEIERLSGLLQRDNLVRGLGVVELVYRMLQCTAGTMALTQPSHHVIATSKAAHLEELSSKFDSGVNYSSLGKTGHISSQRGSGASGGSYINTSGLSSWPTSKGGSSDKTIAPIIQRGVVSIHANKLGPGVVSNRKPLGGQLAMQADPSAGDAVLLRQGRGPVLSAGGNRSQRPPGTIYRTTGNNLPSYLGQNGANIGTNPTVASLLLQQAQLAAVTNAPSGTLGAQAKGNPFNGINGAAVSGLQGLSVISAPAPVAQRPEILVAAGGQQLEGNNVGCGPRAQGSGPFSKLATATLDPAGELAETMKSTKAQRARGATNNLRLREIEMRENATATLTIS